MRCIYALISVLKLFDGIFVLWSVISFMSQLKVGMDKWVDNTETTEGCFTYIAQGEQH